MLKFLLNIPNWQFFCLLVIWFITLLALEFIIIPRLAIRKIKNLYVNSTSFPVAQKNIDEYFKLSNIKEIYLSYLRAISKKCMYIALMVIAFASMLATLCMEGTFDIVVFFSACIAVLEAIDSHYLMVEKKKIYDSFNTDMTNYSSHQDEHEADLLAKKEEERYNSLTPFEQFLEKIPNRPIKKSTIISIDGKKQKYNVEIKKDSDGEADYVELDFGKKVRFINRYYLADTAEYSFSDNNTFEIKKEDGNKKYTITIDLRTVNKNKGA